MEAPSASKPDLTSRIIRRFEHAIVLVLMGLLVVVITLTTVELVWLLVRDVASSNAMLDIEQMFELFGFFLLVLIGMELLATLKAYVYERVIHVEVVLEVALIALAQKIIVLDMSRSGAPTLLGLASVVLALATAFWLVRAARRPARVVEVVE
ncbi:MAG: phosphate-starvation-inducible PsiE family protein [Labilithrix sp.]|nr:phosphate-starvation-inducible PsiE family protein [Labilithrix sp.]